MIPAAAVLAIPVFPIPDRGADDQLSGYPGGDGQSREDA
jgi:hypothetical protein